MHGDFIWYELMTTDFAGAKAFYEGVVGWRIDGGHGDPAYAFITASEGMVGGVLTLSDEMQDGGARPCWLGYVGVDDVDAMLGSIEGGGGTVQMPARDVEQAGRIAMVADPQGAPFYIMKPTPPPDQPDAESTAFSYDRPRMGHCAWNELSTSDPAAALHFYGQRFGWVKDGEMDMGELGTYEFLRHAGRAPDGAPMGAGMIGGVMPLMPGAPHPMWSHYFRVADIDAAAAAIAAGGGRLLRGPDEIPGGDYSINAIDPQGAPFSLVGSRKGDKA